MSEELGLRAYLASIGAEPDPDTKPVERPRKHEDDYDTDMDPAAGWLEASDFAGPGPPGGRPEPVEDRDRRRLTYSRQVCIRLSNSQYQELAHAADLYGVAPGTMGRMLVKRGARAVLDARRRYDLEQDGVD